MSGNSVKSSLNILNLADADNNKKINKKIDATAIFEGAEKLGHEEVAKTVSKEANLNIAKQEIEQKIERREFLRDTIFGKQNDNYGSCLDSLLEKTEVKSNKKSAVSKLNKESGKSLNLNF
jgi:hypothetical protein